MRVLHAALFLALFAAMQPAGSCGVTAVTLRGKTVSIAVPIAADAAEAVLHVDGVQADKRPGGYYEVHVGGTFAGNITFYGVTPSMSRDLTFRVDGTPARTRNGDVTVTFVPRGGAAGSSARVRIRSVRLTHS